LPPADGSAQIGWTQLPGASEIYNPTSGSWDQQSRPHRVPLLGAGGRLAAVTSSSRNAASAFKLLEWLASPEGSSQLARAGQGTMPVRKSLESSPAWYDPALSAGERADLGKALETTLSQPKCLILPRIQSVDEYLAALDQAVSDVVTGEHTPEAALEKASRRWDEITDQTGRDAQRRAYLKHLGLNER
jgi:ABC-type glycerol-3-phosphate transport system substrate-binding protein